MGSIILCKNLKATNPYEITRIHKKIYTIEELCYYLSHNIYLIDNTIMNDQFCKWLDEELELTELSVGVKELLLDRGGLEKFIMMIVRSANIYSLSELNHLEDILNRIKDKKDVELRKAKADNLLENGEIEEAILVYQAMLREKWDDTVSKEFYGKLYACIGAAYGKCFLYKESMEMYDKAFQICNDPMLVKCYLYAAQNALDDKEYRLFLAQSEVFEELDEIITKERKLVETQVTCNPSLELLEEWKMKYRLGK